MLTLPPNTKTKRALGPPLTHPKGRGIKEQISDRFPKERNETEKSFRIPHLAIPVSEPLPGLRCLRAVGISVHQLAPPFPVVPEPLLALIKYKVDSLPVVTIESAVVHEVTKQRATAGEYFIFIQSPSRVV